MTLEELQDQASKDLAIDDTQLDIESLSTPTLHSKYLKIYSKKKATSLNFTLRDGYSIQVKQHQQNMLKRTFNLKY